MYNSYDLSIPSIDYIISNDKKEETEYYKTQHILFTTSTLNLPHMKLLNNNNRNKYEIFKDDEIIFMLYLVNDTLYAEYIIVFRNILNNVVNSRILLLVKYYFNIYIIVI